MQRRSRKGCIDCKKAKVKCDEEQPHCGTCKRRGYTCQGYAIPTPSIKHVSKPAMAMSPSAGPQAQRSKVEPHTPALILAPQWYERRQSTNRSRSRDVKDIARGGNEHRCTPQSREMEMKDRDVLSSDMEYTKLQFTAIARARANLMQLSSCPPLYSTIPDLPLDAIGRTDRPGVEIYFLRHPSELVISGDFVNEMNANVLQVFKMDPPAVAETLSAIGHIYLGEGGFSIVPVLDRKQRILARLRDRRELEQMMVMLLGLSALETLKWRKQLIDARSEPADNSLPAIISNAAIIIKHHQANGLSFSSVAKYFIRALARQDMMISLTYARRPLIPSSVWLSEDAYRQADRFMGHTGTLMPILADLGALAGEMRGPSPSPSDDGANTNTNPSRTRTRTRTGSHPSGGEVWSEEGIPITTNPFLALYQKVLEIRQRLNQWRPPSAPPHVSFQASRNLLFHAHAHRAAALLYLHRLLEPPGSSEAANHVALGMAREVLMYLSAMDDQLKTALWPALVAGAELTEDGDRAIVLGMFDEIVRQRKTVTARRTRDFCVQRLWAARDSGLAWNWIDLAELYPGECVPI